MNLSSLKTRVAAVAVATVILSSTHMLRADVVTYIDFFNKSQSVSTNNAVVTNSTSSAGAIGGFRTLTLNVSGGDPEFPQNATATVSSNTQRFSLSTPDDTIALFEIKWGGAGGTNGIGPVDFTGGFGIMPLVGSTLNFSLRNSDVPSPFTWTFTDSSNNVASYAGTFPAKTATSPALPYAISIGSFSGAGIIDWTSINFITLSGGGIDSLDMGIFGPVYVSAAIPEPATWAAAGLLLLAAVYIRWRRSRTATAVETPATA